MPPMLLRLPAAITVCVRLVAALVPMIKAPPEAVIDSEPPLIVNLLESPNAISLPETFVVVAFVARTVMLPPSTVNEPAAPALSPAPPLAVMVSDPVD